MVEALLGPIIEVDARIEILWPSVRLTDIGKESVRKTADQLSVLGKTRSGAVFTADRLNSMRVEQRHWQESSSGLPAESFAVCSAPSRLFYGLS